MMIMVIAGVLRVQESVRNAADTALKTLSRVSFSVAVFDVIVSSDFALRSVCLIS